MPDTKKTYGNSETKSRGIAQRLEFPETLQDWQFREYVTKWAEDSKRPGVDLYDGGGWVRSCAGKAEAPTARGVRGAVKGWSMASRRRMREYMLTHTAPDAWYTLGLTLTVPGPPLTATEARSLWVRFCRDYIERNGYGMIWRLEVQTRGAVHWHCLVISPTPPPRMPPNLIGEQSVEREMWEQAFFKWWCACLRHLPKVDWTTKRGTCGYSHRSEMFGVEDHAVDVQNSGCGGAWMRYLQDHSSKAKQEQIAVGFGRHWGVVGRSRFVRPRNVERLLFVEGALPLFLRVLQRLATPVLSRRDPFGKHAARGHWRRSLGFRVMRGCRGNSIWYTKPATLRRMVEWANAEVERRAK